MLFYLHMCAIVWQEKVGFDDPRLPLGAYRLILLKSTRTPKLLKGNVTFLNIETPCLNTYLSSEKKGEIGHTYIYICVIPK